MQTTAADPLIGRTLEGRYRILHRIARGGMSTVYAAVDERLDRLVAVKVMSAALSADPSFSDRFSREARAAARLAHLNAVSVYDQGYDSGPGGHHVFLVMELVEGRTLRELLRERGTLTPAEAVSIMEPVLGALAAAHRAGLVHRDVKPENILLSDEGIVKVADFGLARAVESDASATRTGLMMGTVAYCSPEQVSKGRADQRSDVYSAGIVLFELLTGAPPYRGESAMNIAYQHVHSRVPAPSSRVKGIPYEIDELVVEATDSDPAGRPADAATFLAEIADARRQLELPVVAVPPRVRTRAGPEDPPAPRNPPGRLGSGATTDVLGARAGAHDTVVTGRPGLHHSVPPLPRQAAAVPAAAPPAAARPAAAPPGKRAARRHPGRRRALLVLLLVLLLGVAAAYGGWWFAAGRYSRVPDVAGRPVSVATSQLQQAHYTVGTVSMQFSETAGKGTVISTRPGIGSRVVRGGAIALVVSKGKERFKLPALARDSVAAARTALGAIPVQVVSATIARSSDTVKKGSVIGTDPPGGVPVKRGQSITIIVSSGPPIIPIPTIQPNTSFADAKAQFATAGFRVARDDQYSTTVGKGVVLSTDPTGTAVKGATITVVVSKGPQLVTIPNIPQFSPAAAAEATLQGLGLVVALTNYVPGPPRPNAVVLQLDPPAGRSVQLGSTVTLTVF